MADQNHSDLLNRLLVRIYRGVLQYAVECWPWSAAADANGIEPPEQRAIEKMAARQQQLIARLVELLSKRRAAVDFGAYPDYSELHYVSLDYLIGKIIADEERLVAELEAAQTGLQNDPAAAHVVAEILAAEKEHLAQLRGLAAKATSGASA
jgi:Arc/MetJ-type ribon-helix-helix transcriptional regulator